MPSSCMCGIQIILIYEGLCIRDMLAYSSTLHVSLVKAL